MKRILLATVAISALTFAGAAMAQDHTGGPEKSAPAGAAATPAQGVGAEHGASAAAPGHSAAGEHGHSAAAPGHEPAGEHGRSAEAPGHVSGAAAASADRHEKSTSAAGEAGQKSSGAGEHHGLDSQGAHAAARHEHDKAGAKSERSAEHKDAKSGEKGAAAETSRPGGEHGHASADHAGREGAAHDHATAGQDKTGAASSEKGGKVGAASTEKGGKVGAASDAQKAGAERGSERASRSGGEDQGGKDQAGKTAGEASTHVSVSGNLHVARDKAERVHSQLIESARGESHTDVNIHVDVGAVLPERVRPRPLPPRIVEIAPEFRGYDYVVVRDEIVIVQPRSRKVVEVIRGGHGHRHHRHFSLDKREREKVRHDVITRKVETRHIEVREGMEVPSSITLEPLPSDVYAVVPDFRDYQYFVTDSDDVVIVDPQTREVVDVLD